MLLFHCFRIWWFWLFKLFLLIYVFPIISITFIIINNYITLIYIYITIYKHILYFCTHFLQNTRMWSCRFQQRVNYPASNSRHFCRHTDIGSQWFSHFDGLFPHMVLKCVQCSSSISHPWLVYIDPVNLPVQSQAETLPLAAPWHQQ